MTSGDASRQRKARAAFVQAAGLEIEVKEWLWRDGVILLVARAPAEGS